ncbi:MAG: hypothetical protein HJJLKODD_01747 [Phycisphaerae bacterium]|nr:hypothetical protein [Phycisphaerae bacterium]
MSTATPNISNQVFRDTLADLTSGWAGLGVWCTMWNTSGQLLSAIPQSSNFWKALWNHGQGFRNEIGQAVRSTSGDWKCHTIQNVPGLDLHCLTLDWRGGQPAVLVACSIAPDCQWGEEFSRLCTLWQLDEATLRNWGDQQLKLTREQVEQVLNLLHRNLQILLKDTNQQDEITFMTEQLTDAYEELNLIYRVGAIMRVTQKPRDHFRQLFEDLTRTTAFTTIAAILYDIEILEVQDRLIIGGEPIVDEPTIFKLIHSLPTMRRQTNNALIINRMEDYPQLDWARSWLERLIAVPIICNQRMLGVVVVLNRRGNRDFDSTDARLLYSVIDRSAIYLENVLLYGDLNNMLMGLLHALVASIDAKDTYTCGHANRVALISKKISEKCGAPPPLADRVYLSGLLHDVGKIGISELVLCKPGRLNEEEMREMQRHPEIGAKILGGIKQLEDIIPGVLHHHEWLNGSGYPDQLTDDAIPWIAKVVGLADAFDAMTSGRTYRSALPLASAMAEIRRFSGVQFCPRLVEALIQLVNEGLVDELRHVKKPTAFDSVYSKWARRINNDEH